MHGVTGPRKLPGKQDRIFCAEGRPAMAAYDCQIQSEYEDRCGKGLQSASCPAAPGGIFSESKREVRRRTALSCQQART